MSLCNQFSNIKKKSPLGRIMNYKSLIAAFLAPQSSEAIEFGNSDDTDWNKPLFTSASPIWYVVSSILRPSSTDRAFWWRTTGALFAETLYQAKYSLLDQCSSLYFYYVFITPHLGPRPSRSRQPLQWRSFMTDDFTPLEFSWNWGTGTKVPEIRYSVEAVGPESGTSIDPFNQERTMDLISQLRSHLPHTDWTWFDAFHAAFQIPSTSSLSLATSNPATASPSSIFLAFEHRHSQAPVPKAYFVPGLRALTSPDATPLTVVTKALVSLPTHSSNIATSFPAYAHLLNFLNTHSQGQSLSLIFVAIDCVLASQESRLKIYLRSPATDFESVVKTLRMGSSRVSLPSGRQLDSLRGLFHALLPVATETQAENRTKHETSGMLYYFDCAPSHPLPRPKVYMPVKHYARDDQSALTALEGWFAKAFGEEYVYEWVSRFGSLLGRMGVGDTNRNGVGSEGRVQTYVSVGFEDGEKGGLNVTSYLGPGIYARMAGNGR